MNSLEYQIPNPSMLTFNSVENPGRRIDYGFLGNNCILTKEFDIAVVMAGLPL